MLTRILIAAVLSPIAILLIFAKNPYLVTGLIVLSLTLALNELYSMLAKKKMKAYVITGNIFAAAIYALVIAKANPEYFFACLAVFMMTVLAQIVFSRDAKNLIRVFYTVLPVAYIVFLGVFGIYLRMLHNGSWYFFLLLFLTLVYDSGAYFTGTSIGKNKLIPELSPGKTIEGCIGGVAVNIAAAVILYNTLLPKGLLGPNGLAHIIILSVLMSFVGQIGDIAESVFKRFTGVKNSSNLLLDHGGALDRIDSAMFNAPFLYLYLKLVLHVV